MAMIAVAEKPNTRSKSKVEFLILIVGPIGPTFILRPMVRQEFKNLGFGLGFRSRHFETILERGSRAEWFEALTENYLGLSDQGLGAHFQKLEQLREKFPIVFHGVSLSIGSTDPLNMTYLRRVKELYRRIQPEWVSDHLCWTGIQRKNSHDLLPLPLTEESLAHCVERVKRVQDILGRRILLENPSTYLEFKASHIPEWEFLDSLAEQSDCGLLMDVNNVFVSAMNHGWNPQSYIDSIPKERVAQIHLAGHLDCKTHRIDTHDRQVCREVWELYAYAIQRWGAVSTMIEWDERIPELSVLEEELQKARAFAAERRAA